MNEVMQDVRRSNFFMASISVGSGIDCDNRLPLNDFRESDSTTIFVTFGIAIKSRHRDFERWVCGSVRHMHT